MKTMVETVKAAMMKQPSQCNSAFADERAKRMLERNSVIDLVERFGSDAITPLHRRRDKANDPVARSEE